MMTSAERIVSAILDGSSEQPELPFGEDDSSNDISPGEVALPSLHRMSAERAEGRIVYEYTAHDHGVMDCQYWQGVSTVHTRWDDVAVGSGENPHSAMEEALGYLADNGWDIRPITNDFDADAGDIVAEVVADANPDMVDDDGEIDTGDCYNYVVVYVRGVPTGE